MALQWLWDMFGRAADKQDSLGKDAEDDWELLTADRQDTEFRLILVGKSGGGKSAVGNTILGQKEFESTLAAKTVTLKCQRGQGKWRNHKISVVDTPAIFDSKDYDETVRDDIRACVKLSRPGPHALIFVTQVGRFTAEDAAAAKCVWDILGRESAKHTIVLFTCVEDLGGDPLQEYVRTSDNRNLRELIGRCGNRFCGFNNKAAGDEREQQVSELMEMVQSTVSKNGIRYYVNPLYLEPNLQDEHVRTFIEQNQLGDKYLIGIPLGVIISAGRILLSFLNYDVNAGRSLPQLTAGTSVMALPCPAQLVTDPEDRETGARSISLAPKSDSAEVGEEVVSEDESQPGPSAPPEVHMSDSGEGEALGYAELPEGTSG